MWPGNELKMDGSVANLSLIEIIRTFPTLIDWRRVERIGFQSQGMSQYLFALADVQHIFQYGPCHSYPKNLIIKNNYVSIRAK
jgi:hypothetical protein